MCRYTTLVALQNHLLVLLFKEDYYYLNNVYYSKAFGKTRKRLCDVDLNKLCVVCFVVGAGVASSLIRACDLLWYITITNSSDVIR